MFFYRNGHLPYGTADGPHGYHIFPADFESAPEGQGTTYPLLMSMEEYCACFYRVKAWRLTGSLEIDFGRLYTDTNQPDQQGKWTGSHEIDMVFPRLVTDELQTIALSKYVSANNGIDRSRELFGSDAVIESFSGSHSRVFNGSTSQATASYTIEANFCPTIDLETEFAAVGQSQVSSDKLAVVFRLLFTINGQASHSTDGGASQINFQVDLRASTNGSSFWTHESQASLINPSRPVATQLEISGPLDPPKAVNIYLSTYSHGSGGGGLNSGLALDGLTLHPSEWFTYDIYGSGPIYDSETGDFL